jgi:hypothetical protein
MNNECKDKKVVFGEITPTTPGSTYIAAPNLECTCLACSAFTPTQKCYIRDGISDIQTGWATCCGGFCTAQPICAGPNLEECKIGLNSKSQDPLCYVSWNKVAPNQKCFFNLEKIDTLKQVSKFTNKFGLNNEVNNNYCFSKVSNCPDGLNECSRIKSLDEGNLECKLWFESLPPSSQDAYMQYYCTKNKTKECDCVLRSESSTFQIMKGMHGYNDGCWFLPCSDSLKYFIPSNLKNPTCPNNICQIIIDVANAGNVNIDDIKNDLTCNFDPQPHPNPDSFWEKLIKELEKYKIEIFFVIFLIIIFFIIKKK